jgi:hypothetical protein
MCGRGRELVLERLRQAPGERHSRTRRGRGASCGPGRSLERDVPRFSLDSEMASRTRSVNNLLAAACCSEACSLRAQAPPRFTAGRKLARGPVDSRERPRLGGICIPTSRRTRTTRLTSSGGESGCATPRFACAASPRSNGHKPSFRVDFNRYVTGQTFFGLDALTLDSSWQDPSMITNRLSMLIFRRMGIAAPRVAHVRPVCRCRPRLCRRVCGHRRGNGVVPTCAFRRRPPDSSTNSITSRTTTGGFRIRARGWAGTCRGLAPKTHEFESVANLYMPIRDPRSTH